MQIGYWTWYLHSCLHKYICNYMCLLLHWMYMHMHFHMWNENQNLLPVQLTLCLISWCIHNFCIARPPSSHKQRDFLRNKKIFSVSNKRRVNEIIEIHPKLKKYIYSNGDSNLFRRKKKKNDFENGVKGIIWMCITWENGPMVLSSSHFIKSFRMFDVAYKTREATNAN